MKSLAQRFVFNRRHMKWLATLTMFIDHLTVVLAPTVNDLSYLVGRGIGRIAFPLYALLFVDSFFYTSSRKKYLRNLTLFAVISEIPYDKTFHNQWLEFSDQNILFLFVGMSLLLMLAEQLNLETTSLTFWLLVLAGGIGTTILQIDYAIFGMVYMSIVVHIRTQKSNNLETILYLMVGVLFQAPFSFMAIPFIVFYDQHKLTQFSNEEKYFFYFFYPMHIILLFVIQALMLL